MIRITKKDISITHGEYSGQIIEIPAESDDKKDIMYARKIEKHLLDSQKAIRKLIELRDSTDTLSHEELILKLQKITEKL